MWIFDVESLRFLEVNERMLEHYGYKREEIERMTCLDIRPDREKERLQKIIPTYTSKDELYSAGHWVHKKKNGEEIIVDIMTCMMDYGQSRALLVLANDVTKNLELQQELMNSKLAHQREVAKASLSVQEKERTDIGKELHDNVNQILTSVKLHLEMIDAKTDPVHLGKSIDGVKTAIAEIRRLSKSLVPPTFNDMGLIGAIDDLVENMNLYSPLSIKFLHYDFDEDGFSDDLKLTLFRVVQEQLTNVVKHSQASEVLIQLSNDNDYIGLVIDDNGRGCDKGKKRNGIGINNIINRADMFNGEVNIDTEPGKGFRLEVVFPAQKTEARSKA
jgi:PAS domain S-box-containing protein